MSTDSQISSRQSRLNPFVFPSSTDFRFVLLIVSVIGVSLIIFHMLYNTIPGVLERSLATQERCMKSAAAAYPEDPFARSDAFEQCMVPADRVRGMSMFGGVALLLVVAGLIYWSIPVRKIGRSKLVPLSAEDAPEVVAYLADLCREVRLSRPPVFVWNPLNPTSSGLAFGRWGRYYVSLTGGLVAQFYIDRAAFRAVLLHELSHLRNGDVNKTYLAVAIWRAFVAVALVPFVIGQPYAISQLGKTWGNLFHQGWRLLALTVLVYLTRNAVLRAREVYADVRASIWDGPEGALRRELKTLALPTGGRWRSVLSVHPDPGERHRTLDDTDRLFRMGFWDAFGTGLAAVIAYSGFQIWLGFMTKPSLALYFLEVLGAALIFAPLVIGVVGLGVWRTTFAVLARGKSPRGVGRLGLGVGLGAILGQVLNIVAYNQRSSADLALNGWIPFVGLQVLWNSLLLVSLFLFFHWVAVGASTWLEIATTSQSLRPIYRLGLAAAGALLTLWFAFLFFSYPGGSSSGFALVSYEGLARTPVTLVGLMILWAYPLTAWFWRRRVAASSGVSWAFLDPSPRLLRLPRRPPLRPDLALMVGVLGGVLFCALSFALSLGLFLVLPVDLLVRWAVYGQAVLAALIQASVAAVVAVRVKRLGGLHGLFAALVASCIMAVGALVIYVLSSGRPMSYYVQSPPVGTILLLTSAVINGGTLLALPAGLGVSMVAGWVRRSGVKSA